MDGNKPHIGGPITEGSSSVFIEGKKVCRQGDSAQCSSPSSDSIQQGSSSVFINGKPAARVGDSTAHGGVIVGGAMSVFIG